MEAQPLWRVLLFGRRRRLVLFMGLATVYMVTFGPYIFNDTMASAAAAWNLATNGTLDFAAVGFDDVFWSAEGPAGQLYTNRFPGTFLVAVPIYWLTPRTYVTDGSLPEIPYLQAEILAALITAAAVVVLVEVLRELVEPETALGAGVVVGLATPVWSVASSALWTHTVNLLVLSLALRAITRERWWWAGVALGWGVFARPTLAVIAAAIGVWLALTRRSWQILVAIGVPSVAGAAALSWYSHAFFDTWLPIAGYGAGRVSSIVGAESANLGQYSWSEQLLGTFFHFEHGVFPYSLFLLPLLVVIPAGWRRLPDWGRAAAIAGLAYWVLQLRGNRFTGGESFIGYRFPLEPLFLMVPLFTVGYVAWAQRSNVFRRITLAAVGVSVAWMVALAITVPDGTRPRRTSPEQVEAVGVGTVEVSGRSTVHRP